MLFMQSSFALREMQFKSAEEREKFIISSAAKSKISESDNLFIGEIISAKQFKETYDWNIGIIELKIKVLKQNKGIFIDENQILYRYWGCSIFSYWIGENNEWSCDQITQKNKNIFLIASKIEKGWTELMGKNRLVAMSPISKAQIKNINKYSDFYPDKNIIEIFSGIKSQSEIQVNYVLYVIIFLWILSTFVYYKKSK